MIDTWKKLYVARVLLSEAESAAKGNKVASLLIDEIEVIIDDIMGNIGSQTDEPEKEEPRDDHNVLDLIDAHRTVFDTFEAVAGRRLDEDEAGTIGAETESCCDEACDSEDKALGALCGYSCKTIDEARTKAGYLIAMQGDLRDDHVDALLQSFLPQTNDEAEQS